MKIKLIKDPSKAELIQLIETIKARDSSIGTSSAIRTVDLWLQAGFVDTMSNGDRYLVPTAMYVAQGKLPHLFEVQEEIQVDPFAEINRIWDLLKDAVDTNDGDNVMIKNSNAGKSVSVNSSGSSGSIYINGISIVTSKGDVDMVVPSSVKRIRVKQENGDWVTVYPVKGK
jgi:Fe2+ or Zn2+ uptake regulation protein